jgi:hypothetical protein
MPCVAETLDSGESGPAAMGGTKRRRLFPKTDPITLRKLTDLKIREANEWASSNPGRHKAFPTRKMRFSACRAGFGQNQTKTSPKPDHFRPKTDRFSTGLALQVEMDGGRWNPNGKRANANSR